MFEKFTDVNTFSFCSTGETHWAALGERTACCSWQERRKYLKVRFPFHPRHPAHFPDDTSYFPCIGTHLFWKMFASIRLGGFHHLSRCGEGGEAGAGRPWCHPDSQNRHFHLLQAAEALLSPPACRLFIIAIRQLWGRSSRINSGE